MRALIRHLLALSVCCLLLAGCNEVPVAQDIGQKEANRIVALLAANGISASATRDSSGKGRYRVEVGGRNYAASIVIMDQNDLPRDDQSPLNELIAQHGLIPNSREVEALRLDRALALEVQELLLNHPAIASAKVNLRLNFIDSNGEPAVSAVVQAAPIEGVTRDQLIDLIATSVPGVKRPNINVVVEAAHGTAANAGGQGEGVYHDGKVALHIPLAGFLWWRVAEGDSSSMTLAASICLAIMLLAGALLGYWYGFFKQNRQVVETDLPELGPKSLRLDRSKRDVLLNK